MANAQARVVQDPPIYTPFERGGKIADLWRTWTKQVTDGINRTGAVTQGGARALAVVTPGASPWTYQSPYGGDVRLLISGGTVSALAFSRDNVTFYPVGVVAGQITLSQNDFLRVTYTVAPTITAVPA